MTSLLGVYWSVYRRRPQDYDYFKGLNPSVFKVMDGSDADYSWIKQNLPNSLVVARDHPLSEQHADMFKDPVGTGKRHAQEWNVHQQRLGFDKAKTLILGINEPKVWDAGVPEALRKYTIALCDEATVYGLRVGAMQLSVGWPGNKGGDSPPDWSPYHGVDNAIRHNHGALVVHEYWADDGPLENWGWWCGRVLKCPWQVPIIIGETGIDMYVKDAAIHHAHRGWLGRMAPEQYARELAGYVSRMKEDSRYVGCAVFASDYVDDAWKSFDLERAYSAILATPIPDIEPLPPTTPPTNPEPLPPTTPTPEPMPSRDIDPALLARGVHFNFVKVAPGTKYWRITKAQWLEDAANQVGPDHHILGQVLVAKVETGGVTLQVDWPSGDAQITSKADDPNATYNYDYGMSASLNEFGILVSDGNPSDYAGGIGMGYGGNPKAHSSTWITFELVTAEEPVKPPIPPIEPPIPPFPPTGEIETGIVIAPAGLNLREGPSTNTAVLGTLSVGSTVLHDDEQDGWLHVIDGWVSGDYVGDAAATILSPTLPLPPLLPGSLVHPLPGSVITQNFYQNPQAYERFQMPGHDGTDFGGKPLGTPVLSMADGVVVRAAHDAAGYGNFVEVAHYALDATTLYAHLYEIDVQDGQPIGAGDTLGGLGSTGNSTGVHLHLSVRLINKNGSYREDCPMRKGRVDPRTWAILHGLTL